MHWPTSRCPWRCWRCCWRSARLVPRVTGSADRVLLATVVVAVFSLDAQRNSGHRPDPQRAAGARAAAASRLADLSTLLIPAVGIAIVAFSDNVLTAAHVRGAPPDSGSMPMPNCARWACATSAAGLMHGFPVSSSGSRTALGDAARQPHPAVLARHAGVRACGHAVRAGTCWRTSRLAALGALVSMPRCG